LRAGLALGASSSEILTTITSSRTIMCLSCQRQGRLEESGEQEEEEKWVVRLGHSSWVERRINRSSSLAQSSPQSNGSAHRESFTSGLEACQRDR